MTGVENPQIEYMSLFIKLSKVCAMWPRWKSGLLFNIWYFSTIVIFTVTITVVDLSLLFKIFSCLSDMDGIAPVVDYATAYTSGVFRYLYVFFRGATHKKIVDYMYREFTNVSFNPSGKKLTMEKFVVQGKRWSLFYYFSFYPVIFQMILVPFISLGTGVTQIPLIFDGWHPFNVTQEPHHTIAFAVQTASWIMMGYHYLLIDAFWYMIIFVTIGQLRIIQHTFINLVPTSVNDDEPIPECTFVAFKENIKQFQIVRRFIGEVEDCLCPIVLVDFMHGVLSLTFLPLDIIIAFTQNDMVKMVRLTIYLLVSIIHMLAYDWLGNELALQEENVAKAIFNTPWHRAIEKFAVPLTMTTAAARKPIRLSGGKFYYLTLGFFMIAMKTIVSYFMVLIQLRNDE